MRKSRHRPVPAPKKTAVPELTLEQLSRQALRTKLRGIDTQLKSSQDTEEMTDLRTQRESIVQELQSRQQTNRKLVLLSVAVLSSTALIFILFALINKAEQAEANLRCALHEENPTLITSELQRAQKGLNILLNPSLKSSITEANNKLASFDHELESTKQLLDSLEQDAEGWQSVTPAQIRRLKSPAFVHTESGQQLIKRWKELVAQRRASKLSLRSDSLEKMLRPLPPAITLSSHLESDLDQIRDMRHALHNRLREWKTLQEIHHLDAKALRPLRKRLQGLKVMEKDIRALQQLEDTLVTPQSYEDYILRLRGYKARAYPVGRALGKLVAQLPSRDTLQQHIMTRRGEISSQQLDGLESTLLEAAPSFNPSRPANVAQIALMEEIFQSRPLQLTLYQLRNPGLNQSWTSETAPVVNKKQLIELKLSHLDPLLRSGQKIQQTIQPNPQLELREFRPFAVLQELRLTRQDFYRTANLPLTLEQLLSHKSPYTNARYKCYLYKVLSKVILEDSQLSHLSPTLRKDVDSLRHLERQSGIKLNDLAWLRYGATYQRAESLYAAWLSERVGRQYLREMQFILRAQLRTDFSFVGYITSTGKAHFYHDLASDEPLLYIDRKKNALKLGSAEHLSDAAAFSPIFHVQSGETQAR